MSSDKAVSEHYVHGNLLKAIQNALPALGKTIDNITIEDLAPIDEFHIGGRQATENFLGQLNFSEKNHLLDVGCGLGGASRYIAKKYNNRVTGIDLTEEYIETGNILCSWVKLDQRVRLHLGSALSMPFQDESFDGAFMLHVGMNTEGRNRRVGAATAWHHGRLFLPKRLKCGDRDAGKDEAESKRYRAGNRHERAAAQAGRQVCVAFYRNDSDPEVWQVHVLYEIGRWIAFIHW